MIYIDNRQSEIEVTDSLETTIKKVIDYAVKMETDIENYEVSVIFVNNEGIKRINCEQRNIDKVTDVLSFPMLDYPEGKVYRDVYIDFKFDESFFDDENLVLGDIALSLEKSLEQSEEYEHSFVRETTYLLVHSVLHLLGYDHMNEDDKQKMRKREEEILSKLNIFRK